MGLTRSIARFIVETDDADIPQDAYEHAKVAFMDWMAVTLAGKDDPLVAKLIHHSDVMGGYEQATILGHGLKKNIAHAALINGAASHALDYDDSMKLFVGHPTVTLYPSLLAISEWKEMRGRDLLAAYLIGLQAASAIGSCGGMEHYMHGWHATSTIGHFASASGCARLMKLDKQQTVYALGIAGTQCSGLKSAFGTMCKPFHAGKASQSGLMAAMLAGDGFTGAENIVEGDAGFINVLNGKVNADADNVLTNKWHVDELMQKYHASCHATHSPIEGARLIVDEEGIDIVDIKSIKLYVSQLAVGAAGKTSPKTGLEGKFSISYCVANALLRKDTGNKAFSDEKVNDPQIIALMDKISVEVKNEYKMVETIVEITTGSGKIYTRSADVMTDVLDIEAKKTKIKDKFIDLSTPVLGKKKTEQLLEFITNLDKVDNVKTMIECMRMV